MLNIWMIFVGLKMIDTRTLSLSAVGEFQQSMLRKSCQLSQIIGLPNMLRKISTTAFLFFVY